MKDVFTTKCRLTLMISNLNINADFAKDLMHNTIYFFVANCWGGDGSNKMHRRQNYQDILKWGVAFRSFSYNN